MCLIMMKSNNILKATMDKNRIRRNTKASSSFIYTHVQIVRMLNYFIKYKVVLL